MVWMILFCCLVGRMVVVLLSIENLLSSSITPLCTNSNRFCAVKLREFSGSSVLLVSVYLPSESVVSSFSDYLNTLGELEGFIESQHCDSTLVAGDFNVDFDRGGPLASLLEDFASEQTFVVCDLSYRESVKFTYERDGGLVHFWIDHVVCSESLSSRITDVHSVTSGANMSNHLPLSFQFHIPCASINTLPSSVSSKPKACINWSKVTPSTGIIHRAMLPPRQSHKERHAVQEECEVRSRCPRSTATPPFGGSASIHCNDVSANGSWKVG